MKNQLRPRLDQQHERDVRGAPTSTGRAGGEPAFIPAWVRLLRRKERVLEIDVGEVRPQVSARSVQVMTCDFERTGGLVFAMARLGPQRDPRRGPHEVSRGLKSLKPFRL